jgi:hypothetical protein
VRWEGAVAEMLVEDLRSRGHAVEIVASNVRYQDTEHDFMAAEIDFEVRLDGEGEVTNVELKTVPRSSCTYGRHGQRRAAGALHGASDVGTGRDVPAPGHRRSALWRR